MGQTQTPPSEYKPKTSADNFRGTVISSTLTVLVISIAILIFGIVSTQMGVVVLTIMVLFVFVSLIFAYRNKLTPARIITPVAVFLTITFFMLDGDGIHDATVVGYSIVVILAGLLLGQTGVAIFGVMTTLAMAGIAYSELNGSLIKSYSALLDVEEASVFWILNLGFSLIVFSLIRQLSKIAESASRNEAIQINLNAELNTLKEGLEQRVEERTQALEEASGQLENRAQQLQAIAEVSQSAALLHNLEELLPIITQQINRNFGFYHIAIFLRSQRENRLTLKTSNSSGGKRMMKSGYELALGEGSLVGRVGLDGIPRIILDTRLDTVYLAHPDLPDTLSEIAIPLKSGREIIGVLDIQSKEESAFTQEDVKIFQTLANQVAIAIENARQFERAQVAREEAENLAKQYIRQEWGQTAKEQAQIGYRYADGDVYALSTSESPYSENDSIVKVPVKLRGEIIGNFKIHTNNDKAEIPASDMELIEAIAERAAIAMENARLLEDSQRRANTERTIANISTKISGAADFNSIIQTTLKELQRNLGGSRLSVQFSEETNEKDSEQ